MDRERKQVILKEHGLHGTDTGSADVQVAVLTERITSLTEHLKAHRHDHGTRTGLLRLVGQRRRLLAYLSHTDTPRYRALIAKLGLRR